METYKSLPTGEVEKVIPEIKEVMPLSKARAQLTMLKKRVESCPMCKMAREVIASLEAIGVKETESVTPE